jgi:hypothetical protein
VLSGGNKKAKGQGVVYIYIYQKGAKLMALAPVLSPSYLSGNPGKGTRLSVFAKALSIRHEYMKREASEMVSTAIALHLYQKGGK